MAFEDDEQTPLIRHDKQVDQGRWNSSTLNALRVAATFWSFIISGLNDSLYGVRILHPLHVFFLLLTMLLPRFLFRGYGLTVASIKGYSSLTRGTAGVLLRPQPHDRFSAFPLASHWLHHRLPCKPFSPRSPRTARHCFDWRLLPYHSLRHCKHAPTISNPRPRLYAGRAGQRNEARSMELVGRRITEPERAAGSPARLLRRWCYYNAHSSKRAPQ